MITDFQIHADKLTKPLTHHNWSAHGKFSQETASKFKTKPQRIDSLPSVGGPLGDNSKVTLNGNRDVLKISWLEEQRDVGGLVQSNDSPLISGEVGSW